MIKTSIPESGIYLLCNSHSASYLSDVPLLFQHFQNMCIREGLVQNTFAYNNTPSRNNLYLCVRVFVFWVFEKDFGCALTDSLSVYQPAWPFTAGQRPCSGVASTFIQFVQYLVPLWIIAALALVVPSFLHQSHSDLCNTHIHTHTHSFKQFSSI